jgi:hypothetical protein
MVSVLRVVVLSYVLVLHVALPAPVAAASIGVDAATLAAAQMGKPYLLGTPARPGAYALDPAAFDCSGLVWWVAGRLGVTDFPLVAATQAQVGQRLSVTPWEGELPIGALLFLADPRQGPGITHVSLYLGNGIAADCYNTDDGCIAHDIRSDNYYYRHWAFATYPWGDTPETAASGAGVYTVAGGTDGSVAAAIAQAGQGSGAGKAAAASPVAALTGVSSAVNGVGATAIAGRSPSVVAAEQMAPVGGLIGYAKAADILMPLKIVPLISAMLLVLVLRVLFSVVRYVIDLLPG